MHKVANFICFRFRFADPANRKTLGPWETPKRVFNSKQTNRTNHHFIGAYTLIAIPFWFAKSIGNLQYQEDFRLINYF